MKKTIIILSILLNVCAFNAYSVNFNASAPEAIPAGQPFRLVYSLDQSGAKDLRIPELPAFDVLAGPFESRSSSVQIINGQVNSSTTLSYTYTLMAKNEGTFTIPAASIYIDNQRYTSNAVTIRVLPANQQSSASQSAADATDARRPRSNNISNENLFVRAIPSKTRLFEQDYLLITYKLYAAVDIVGYSMNKMPDFKGFLKQDIELPKQPQLKLENYNGRNYSTIVLYQALLYPQQSGKITIDKAIVEPVVRVRTRAQVRSIFDDFFDRYQEVKKEISVPAVTINVDKLPQRPTNFSGAVGNFTFSSSITSENVSVNDPITLKYTISGNGNLKLVKNPEIEFPEDFEVYDPKVNNNYKNTTSGVKGSKTVEYLLIPRSHGDFELPSYTFTYFDVDKKMYKEIKTPSYKIHVKKGVGSTASNQTVVSNFANQEELKVLGKDIRYIETEHYTVNPKQNFFLGTLAFWLWILVPFALLASLIVIYKKRLKENADLILVKNKKANKVAIKRLRTANKYLHEQKKAEFYDEVLRALWGYLSDKLSIPVSELSKDNISIVLSGRAVSQDDITEFMDVLSVCEFARYAPSADSHAMDVLYERAATIIGKFQDSIK